MNRIVQTLAQPYGIISSDRAKDRDGLPPISYGSFAVFFYFRLYWQTLDRKLFARGSKLSDTTVRSELR